MPYRDIVNLSFIICEQDKKKVLHPAVLQYLGENLHHFVGWPFRNLSQLLQDPGADANRYIRKTKATCTKTYIDGMSRLTQTTQMAFWDVTVM